MVEPKVTTMAITVVDLQCHKCYKKIKKLLCKFPQIRDQIYDEKKNTVTIKVVCCCPEKIKQKICCKGGESVIRVEILPPPPEKPPQPPPEKPPQKPPPEKPPQKPPPEKPPQKPPPEKPPQLPPEKPPPQKPVLTVPCYPPVLIPVAAAYPIGVCCTECSEGRGGGPCWRGYGHPPLRFYEGCCGRPRYDSWAGGCYVCEENPSACSFM